MPKIGLATGHYRVDIPRMHHTDEDLDHLSELLNRIPVECDGMELSELDGFIAGLLVCPDMIMPSEWLSLVWGGEGGGKFANLSEVQEVTTAIMDHYNRVAQTLATDPDLYDPIYGADMNCDDLLWEPWIDGFETAMALRPNSWIKIVESGDDEASSSISMIIAMHGIYIGETDLDDEAIDEIDKIGPELIPNFVRCLNRWTKSQQAQYRNVLREGGTAAPETQPTQFRGRKIGRNDPCYCGSGRKYKRCCGAH